MVTKRIALCMALAAACGPAEEQQPPGFTAGLATEVTTHSGVSISVQVSPTTTGRLQTFLSTTVQPDQTTVGFFHNHPQGLTLLQNRNIQRLHIQPHDPTIPLQAPNTWNFADVDSLVQPVLPLGDKSPQYHALPPDFLKTCDSNGCYVPSSNFPAYASYMQDLVRYYNTGGFTIGSQHFQSPSSIHIPYWAILDEPNINGFTGTRYAQLYNTVVPAMKSVDPTIKLVAMEMDDFDGTDFTSFVTSFAKNVNLTKAPVAALGIHYYASCNQKDTDQDLLWETGVLVSHLSGFRSALKGTALASIPFWLTENNVNADFALSDGTSNCNSGQKFVADARGSSAFFAAWRPYTFSQVVQSGANVGGLFQFEFPANVQYGEINLATGTPYLSYWVDQWLDHYLGYRISTGQGASLLSVSNSDSADVEVLAAKRDVDGSVVVMIADHAVRSQSDDNGSGLPCTAVVDLSQMPAFHSATLLTIDKNTNLTTGPSPQMLTPAKSMTVNLGGYGVAFLSLL